MDEKINSEEYWDKRFSSGDWKKQGGNEQTSYFYNLLLDNLPSKFKTIFDKEKYTICDVGCAEGDGTNILKHHFSAASICGIDIAESAIEIAKSNYPNLDFKTVLSEKYDLVISSNTLEHFENPTAHFQELFEHASKYLIVLVPFEEYERISEHFCTFTYEYFKLKYKDFSLIFMNEIQADKDFWNGKQLLLVFQKNIDIEKVTFETLGVASLLKSRENEIFNQKKINLDNNYKLTEQEQKIKEIIQEKETMALSKDEIINQKNQELNSIYSSNFWKLASTYYSIKEKPLLRPLVKVARNVKNHGFLGTSGIIIGKVTKQFQKVKNEKEHKRVLQEILDNHQNKIIIILPVLVDWNIPLFQRPQHLANNISKQGILYFYCTPNGQYDHVDGFENVSEGCYITNRFDLLDGIDSRKKVYDLSSTDNNTNWSFVENRLNRGDGIIYQYIDEISEEISGMKIPKEILEKHFNILKDERCIVIPSATKLENDVKEYRNKNFKLVTNGVEVEHFLQKFSVEQQPKLIKEIMIQNKPIIGYFGAFASWFDYELIIKLAKERENFNILLLGVDYDGSIKKYQLEQYTNITVAGPIDYKQLPLYASCFDVSMIPFLINDITESTSPIKLFEYMAMGRPIVTTNMPECRKYKSVFIGKTHQEFIEKIDEALAQRDIQSYLDILEKEAYENSWETKAKDIVGMLKNEDN